MPQHAHLVRLQKKISFFDHPIDNGDDFILLIDKFINLSLAPSPLDTILIDHLGADALSAFIQKTFDFLNHYDHNGNKKLPHEGLPKQKKYLSGSYGRHLAIYEFLINFQDEIFRKAFLKTGSSYFRPTILTGKSQKKLTSRLKGCSKEVKSSHYVQGSYLTKIMGDSISIKYNNERSNVFDGSKFNPGNTSPTNPYAIQYYFFGTNEYVDSIELSLSQIESQIDNNLLEMRNRSIEGMPLSMFDKFLMALFYIRTPNFVFDLISSHSEERKKIFQMAVSHDITDTFSLLDAAIDWPSQDTQRDFFRIFQTYLVDFFAKNYRKEKESNVAESREIIKKSMLNGSFFDGVEDSASAIFLKQNHEKTFVFKILDKIFDFLDGEFFSEIVATPKINKFTSNFCLFYQDSSACGAFLGEESFVDFLSQSPISNGIFPVSEDQVVFFFNKKNSLSKKNLGPDCLINQKFKPFIAYN